MFYVFIVSFDVLLLFFVGQLRCLFLCLLHLCFVISSNWPRFRFFDYMTCFVCLTILCVICIFDFFLRLGPAGLLLFVSVLCLFVLLCCLFSFVF